MPAFRLSTWLFVVFLAVPVTKVCAAPSAQLIAPAAPSRAASHAVDGDIDIERALQARLASIDELRGVTVVVDNGTVQLDGTVLEAEQRVEASTIAAAIPGVRKVDSRIVIDSNLHTRFRAAYGQVTIKLVRLVAALPLLVIAALVVVLSIWLAGLLSRRLHWLRLRTQNPYMDGLIQRGVQIVIVLVGIVLAFDLLGVTSLVGAVLGSAGVIGLALGFAFKDIAENFIAGILLSVRQPFAPGEHVRIDVHEGKVVALTSRATLLMTLDGNQLRLPNALVFKSVILNYSQNAQRRFDFAATIDGGESIREAQTLGIAAIEIVDGVLSDPGPSWIVVDNTPSGIAIRFYGWIDQTHSDLGKTRSEAIRAVKAAWSTASIEGPRSVYHVVSSREPGSVDTPRTTTEPMHGTTDTSVNRDIDRQLAQAQRADEERNLLDPAAPDAAPHMPTSEPSGEPLQ